VRAVGQWHAPAGEGAEAQDFQPGEVFGVSAWAKAWWPVALSLYQLRAAWGATGQLSGIWLELWGSASGGAAQSASMFITGVRGRRPGMWLRRTGRGTCAYIERPSLSHYLFVSTVRIPDRSSRSKVRSIAV